MQGWQEQVTRVITDKLVARARMRAPRWLYLFLSSLLVLSAVASRSVDAACQWTQVEPYMFLPNGHFTKVAYGAGTVVAVGVNVTGCCDERGVIYASRDGLTFTQVFSSAKANYYSGVAWSGQSFVAVSTGYAALSQDGLNWTEVPIPLPVGGSVGLYGVGWAGQFVAVGLAGMLLTSPDGVTWTQRISCTSSDLYGVGWDGTKIVAVGGGAICESYDGVGWQSAHNTGGASGLRAAVASASLSPYPGQPLFIAVGSGSIVGSLGGGSWTPYPLPEGLQAEDVAASPAIFVAVGQTGVTTPIAATSPNGIDWTRDNSFNAWVHGICWTGQSFFVVGDGGFIARRDCPGSPQADFTWSPTNPQVNETIQFTDHSTGSPTSWAWDFGDSSTSTQQNPTHNYASAGTRTVTLKVSNLNGTSSTAKQLTVSPAATATLNVASANPSSGVGITVTPTDSTGQGSGTTPFSRSYPVGTSVTLTAPSTAAGNGFQKWQMNGADLSTNTQVMVSFTSATTMTALYIAPLNLKASNFKLWNGTQYASHFNLWFDVTDTAGNAVDPAGFNLSIVLDSGATVAVCATAPTAVPDPGGKRWRAEFVINMRDPASGAPWFEAGRLKIIRKSDGATTTLPADNFDLAVYGTDFDLGTHAYAFANKSWSHGNVLTHEYMQATETVAEDLDEDSRPDFWKAVGADPQAQQITDSEGLCYGMAASSIANFVHHADSDYWGEHCEKVDAVCYWNSTTDSSWGKTIDQRDQQLQAGSPPLNRPLDSANVYLNGGTTNEPTLEAWKKIMYYFVAQSSFRPSAGQWWVGRDVDRTDAFSWAATTNLLSKGKPVLFSLLQRRFGVLDITYAHAIAITAAARLNNNCQIFAYDNEYPFGSSPGFAPMTSLMMTDCNSKSLNGLAFSSVMMADPTQSLRRTFALTEGYVLSWTSSDSQWIYGSPRPAGAAAASALEANNSVASAPSSTGLSDAERQLLLDRGYLRIELFGADSVVLVPEGLTTPLPLVAGGELDGTSAVIESVPDGYLSTVYVPAAAGVRYRVTATKKGSSPVLLAFVDVPSGSDSLDAIGYENLEVSPTDVTTVAFWVGRGNSDHGVARTSSAGVNDTVAPTFIAAPTLAVPAVNDFAALNRGAGVSLTWGNPANPGFALAVVVRTTDGPASSPTVGTVVYQGKAQAATDASPGTGTVFYTAFSLDGSGAATASTWLEINLGAWCISGTVATQSGTPVAGAEVDVTTPTGTPLVTESDATGHYAICNLGPGTYAVAVSASGYTFGSSPQKLTIANTSVISNFVAADVAMLAVTSPGGGERWLIGSTQYIGWQVHAIPGNVTVGLSRDGGTSWQVLGTTAAGTRALVWTVTGPSSDACLVRIAGPGDQPVAVSSQPFEIQGSSVASKVRRHLERGTSGGRLTFTPTPNPANVGQAVAFAFSPHLSQSGDSLTFNFGDGSSQTISFSPALCTLGGCGAISHTYVAAGAFTVTVSGTAGGASASGSTSVTVQPACTLPSAPVASFTYVRAGLTVQFIDVSTGEPTSWAWNFGDGVTSTAQSPSHNFTSPGTYTVTLTVTNCKGSSQAQQTITVASTCAQLAPDRELYLENRRSACSLAFRSSSSRTSASRSPSPTPPPTAQRPGAGMTSMSWG